MNFVERLNIRFTYNSKELVQATMPVVEDVLQPFGYLHGGATIALLESIASQGAILCCEEGEIPFGVDVHIAHRSSMRSGTVSGEARLLREDRTSKGHRKQTWECVARNPEGGVVSEGTIICLIVRKDSLQAADA